MFVGQRHPASFRGRLRVLYQRDRRPLHQPTPALLRTGIVSAWTRHGCEVSPCVRGGRCRVASIALLASRARGGSWWPRLSRRKHGFARPDERKRGYTRLGEQIAASDRSRALASCVRSSSFSPPWKQRYRSTRAEMQHGSQRNEHPASELHRLKLRLGDAAGQAGPHVRLSHRGSPDVEQVVKSLVAVVGLLGVTEHEAFDLLTCESHLQV